MPKDERKLRMKKKNQQLGCPDNEMKTRWSNCDPDPNHSFPPPLSYSKLFPN
ncbi:10094_t:CDS:1, partial [Dentiscutata erythropus]